jgi:hypothetical protein
MNPLSKQIAIYRDSRGLNEFPDIMQDAEFIHRQFNAILDVDEAFCTSREWNYRKESTLYQEYLLGSGYNPEDLDKQQYESIYNSFNYFEHNMDDTGHSIRRALRRER